MNWGAYYRRVSAKLELERTEGMRIEPRPLGNARTCNNCHDHYDLADEDDEHRYRGLCLGCAEWFRDQDNMDALIREDEDRTEGRRFYGG
jgi:hypothetical protein